MKKILFSIFTLSFITISLNFGQVAPVEKGLQAITLDAIKAQLGFLASDWTEGRMAGEKGEFLSADPPGGTDHRSFVNAGVPIMRFKPGHREEYHTPMDEPDTIDWDIMEKIIRISFTDVWELANTNW
jgi:hypothetical protein